MLVIVDHLRTLASDLKQRFSDLNQIYFLKWVMQSLLVDLSDVSTLYHEVSEMQR